jgi:hypothetical protein
MSHRSLLQATLFLTIALALGCEESKPATLVTTQAARTVPSEEVAPAPAPLSAPTIAVTEAGPTVRGMTAIVLRDKDEVDVVGRGKLASYLAEEKTFLSGHDLTIQVERQAKPQAVAILLSELAKLSPGKIRIATDTRAEFPREVEFVPQESLSTVDPCTLVGAITDDRGSAIWKVSGGTARKRGRGMGGPDLSMTAETILSVKKGCESDLFFVGAAEGVEWGLVYDLAASGLALEKAQLKRAVVPTAPLVAGNRVEF